jgi:glutathione synthase/RimK-type ligase-like ATP-grasp enzyme
MKYVFPYKTASRSARSLAEALDAPLLGADINLVRGKAEHKVINWGSGSLPAPVKACTVINKEEAVLKALNKLNTFRSLSAAHVPIPEFTTSQATARGWLAARTKVCARTELEGKDGSGLVLVGPTDGWSAPVLPAAPLYTKFIVAANEYRINVCNGRTMGVQLKVRDGTKQNPSPDIKTGGNGYGFRLLSENEIPTGIRPVARAAITALGLDFGGVDLIVGADGNPYVLEVNTAPELTPAMVTAYANMFRTM